MTKNYLSRCLTELSRSRNCSAYISECFEAIVQGNPAQKHIARLSINRIHAFGRLRLNRVTKFDLLATLSDFEPYLKEKYVLNIDEFNMIRSNVTMLKVEVDKSVESQISLARICIINDQGWSSHPFDSEHLNLIDFIALALAYPANIFYAEYLCPLTVAFGLIMKKLWGTLIISRYDPSIHPSSEENDILPLLISAESFGDSELRRIIASSLLISRETLASLQPIFAARIIPNKKNNTRKVVVARQCVLPQFGFDNGATLSNFWLESIIHVLADQLVNCSRLYAHSIVGDSREGVVANNDEIRRSKRIVLEYSENLSSNSLALIKKLTTKNEEYAKSYLRIKSKADKKILRIMIGTLYSGESELESLKKSLSRQTYPIAEHYIVSNLPNLEAHNTLYEYFLRSSHDLLIKLDADMVLTDDSFVENIAKGCIWSKSVSVIQSAIFDYYSGAEIQGVNCYTKLFRWDSSQTHSLFTDRSAVKGLKKKVVWNSFIRSVIHCPSPHPFQAFHFGVHRALKARTAYLSKNYDSALEQLVYLEKLRVRFKVSNYSRPLAYAYAGYLYCLTNPVAAKDVDYTNESLAHVFADIESLSSAEIFNYIDKLESVSAHSTDSCLSGLIYKAKSQLKQRVRRIGLIVPHLHSFGGIFRFIELSMRFLGRGCDSRLIVPDKSLDDEGISWINDNYGQLSFVKLSEALEQDWDVVVCGDFSSGIMLYLPLFKARLRCAYLLNGWQHRLINVKQIEAVNPEIVIANSSYCASHYPDLFPSIVPGGIDFVRISAFKKKNQRRLDIITDVVRVVCPSGRRKPRKRFDDALDAIRILAGKGIQIELNTFDVVDITLDNVCGVHHVHHKGLSRNSLFRLLSEMDIGIYPEEDAGWNNPVAEAACCHLPVICTAAGTSDFITHLDSGFVVPPRSPDAIAKFTEDLILDIELRNRLSSRAFDAIRAFDWQKVADRLLEKFEETRHKPITNSPPDMTGISRLINSRS